MKLGFVRTEMGTQKAVLEANTKAEVPRFSLLGAAELFASRYRDYVCDPKDEGTPLRRIRLRLPLAREFYARVMEGGFYEDFSYLDRLGQEFLIPLRRKKESEIPLTDDIDLESFVRIWRFFQFFCFVDIYVLLPFAKSDPTMMFNSLVRIAKEEDMVGMMTEIGIDPAKAREFLRLVAADVHNIGYFDLQYRPLLRIATATVGGLTSPQEILHLAALVGVSNILRNVQSANKLRLATNAEFFAEAVAGALRGRFKYVTTNRRIKVDGESTDIDVAVFEGKRLYVFECKHSLPPTGPHETRDIWEDVEKAVHQLRTTTTILRDPKRLHDYVTGWFPGTTPEQTAGLEIVPCVLCSHRIFAGLSHNGIPIRDFSSLSKLLDDGLIGLGTAQDGGATMYRFRIINQGGFSPGDLEDYVGRKSKYFQMFLPFMHPTSRIEVLGNFTVARETYTYEVEVEEWLDYMASIGCERQTDEHTEFTLPWSGEELRARLEEKRKTETQPTDLLEENG